jgi:hypothetical protein
MRRVLLMIATVLAFMGYGSSAMADEPVVAVTEPGFQSCTLATCMTQMVNSGLLETRGHVFGIEVHSLDCNSAFVLRMAANGSGTMSSFAFTPGDPNCVDYVPCNAPWSFTSEEVSSNVTEMDVNACFDLLALGRCQGTVSLTVAEPSNHSYGLAANDHAIIGGSGTCEITGVWVPAAPSNKFEVVHQ